MPARVNKALLFGLIGGLVVIAVVVAVIVLWKAPLEDRRRDMLRQADEHSEKGERQQEIFLLQGWINQHRDDLDLRDIHLRLARLYEDEKHYCMIADLAGVQVEEIDLRVDEGMLILSGRRDTPGMQQQFGEKRVHLMEIDHGRFCRKVQLPSDVIIDKIQASYRVGYLVVRLPKKEE